MSEINPFEKYGDEYDAWFEQHPWVYLSELEAVRGLIPGEGKGIEIGVGTGRFAGPLGIKIGVDPSKPMGEIARRRGIEVVEAQAESIPFPDGSFDFALMVTTICFLNDVSKALCEIFRVLKPEGSLVVGFIDKDSPLGKKYLEKKETHRFYRFANFYCVDNIKQMLKCVGFRQLTCVQTLFGDIRLMEKPDPIKEGVGLGSFVVIKAEK